MNYKALFIGVDYKDNEYRKIENTHILAKLINYIKEINKIDKIDCELIADNEIIKATYEKIYLNLYKLGLETWSKNINTVFIYYIGDTINITDYVQSYYDNYNIKEGITPNDYNVRGVIAKEKIYEILKQYNPRTKIIFIADACFKEDNIFDLDYVWYESSQKLVKINQKKDDVKIITISYNLATYSTDDDNYYNILNNNETISKKSLGDYLIKLSYANENILDFLKAINGLLKKKNINMRASLSSSYELNDYDKRIFNCFSRENIQIDYYENYINKYKDVTNEFTYKNIIEDSRHQSKQLHHLQPTIYKQAYFPKYKLRVPQLSHIEQSTVPQISYFPNIQSKGIYYPDNKYYYNNDICYYPIKNNTIQPIQNIYECYC